MHHHAPSVLKGPITQKRPWWAGSEKVSVAISEHESREPLPGTKPPSKPGRRHGIRRQLVERVRREIANGTYETPEKWAIALGCLLDSLEDPPREQAGPRK